MGSANKHLPSSKPSKTPFLSPPPQHEIPKMPSRSSDTEDKTPPPPTPKQSQPFVPPLSIDGSGDDAAQRRSKSLNRPELLRRRSRRVKQLARYYKAQYWALMEEIKFRYREYYWQYGKSPFADEEEGGGEGEREGRGESTVGAEGSGENSHRLGLGFWGKMGNGENERRCTFAGCKSRAMALTSYCHQHILSDSKQKLYKACSYVIKSAPTGPIICGKPVLRAAVPSLCTVHFQMAQKHVSRALKKAGLNTSSSSKLAPKFHVIIAEYVRQIQAKRREERRHIIDNVVVKEEKVA
ncbi:uncharacterized protein LOC131246347 [Magnolia sinica]|uniref:uncharacterized protein LOC131246347 n=1 Tax=Magnolia sinica TaxID=86752 RepID=UPI00265926CE|nr:uncharacterized protein LOC131246347 [Magnolia sinica]XP_058102361.1 uncharacterized protein LOC131246347 [Magnolia sinica]XP_058102362.1 uncharacterized protein LOC131246347 [Magnolia sinica]XP_058102363.1 uncharacterized protein LOC131246347 [Magnolia sinica]XP_058102364.1 uncharacterized protein LOC131246347 [Magnolia sinica]XP_058102365.1 uncharacterized protein LOC131246347 [Magnolia sinica]XP_058102366.1 uncharacterized protein LOC131246347 [Magnolia sinica]XP_058102367.1 uncharacte